MKTWLTVLSTGLIMLSWEIHLEECPRCLAQIQPVSVHGHVQCPVCRLYIVECCNGERDEVPQMQDQKDTGVQQPTSRWDGSPL